MRLFGNLSRLNLGLSFFQSAESHGTSISASRADFAVRNHGARFALHWPSSFQPMLVKFGVDERPVPTSLKKVEKIPGHAVQEPEPKDVAVEPEQQGADVSWETIKDVHLQEAVRRGLARELAVVTE